LKYWIIGEINMGEVKFGHECPLRKERCLDSLCAWWIVEDNACSFVSIAQSLKHSEEIKIN